MTIVINGLYVLAATVPYALPARSNRVHVTGAGAVDVSADGTTYEVLTLTANEATTSARFIKSTAGATVSVSPA